MTPPLEIRKLRAEMEMKFISLTFVAKKTKLHISKASEILRGKRNDSEALGKIAKVIHEAPMPVEEVA